MGEQSEEQQEMPIFPTPLPHALNPLPQTQRPLPEKLIHTPLPLDASQEVAVRAVKDGQSLVVQGPPGTGKSQLIANLMADAAASGKRVLLVCQKRAALDVVQKRLRQVGMGPFLALIHDFQDDRRALYAQIADQINQIDAYRQQNNSLNAVLFERDFEVESRRIDDIVAELEDFKQALFDTAECGISAKELYLTCKDESPTIALEDSYPQFNLAHVDNFIQRLTDYAAYQQRINPEHPWAARVNFSAFTNADLSQIDQRIIRWTDLRDATNQKTKTVLGQPLSLSQLADWQAHDWDITALVALLDTPDAPDLWAVVNQLRTISNHPVLAIDETRMTQLADAWAETLAAPGPEMSLPTNELRAFRELLTDALAARSSWVRWNWWQLTNAGKAQVQAVATANGLSVSEPDLQTLATKVNQRIRLEATRHEVQPFLADLALPESPESLHLLHRAKHLRERIQDLPVLQEVPALLWQTHSDFTATVTAIMEAAAVVTNQQVETQYYLTQYQLTRLWEAELAPDFRQSLRTDFDLLVESDRLQEGFSDTERTVIQQLAHLPANTWATVFQNSLRLAWLNHLEEQHPELRSVSSLKMSQWEQSSAGKCGQKATPKPRYSPGKTSRANVPKPDVQPAEQRNDLPGFAAPNHQKT